MIAISVVIPAYNSSTTIRSTLDSVLPQLEAQDQVVVVNDGSTDTTQAILDEYRDEHQVQCLAQDNAGVSAARNIGVQQATGDYILFLDADDRLMNHAINHFRSYVAEHPEKQLICAGHVTVDDDGKRREHRQSVLSASREQNFVDYVLNKKFSIPNGAVCIRRSVLDQLSFSESLPVSEDFCLYAQILANHDCGSFSEPTVEVKKHAQSLRHQIELFEEASQQIADVLFDKRFIPDGFMKYRKQFVCNRKLSLFRAQYLAGEYDKAEQSYRDAIACRPLNIFKLSYLRKYLRLKLGTR